MRAAMRQPTERMSAKNRSGRAMPATAKTREFDGHDHGIARAGDLPRRAESRG